MLVYDVECINPPIYNNKKPKYKYANGWDDYKGMGIAVVSIYDYETGKICSYFGDDRIYVEELSEIFNKVDIISGFNIKKYDNNMLRAHGIEIDDNKCYDILEQLWFACGLDNNFNFKTHGGFSLDKVLAVNFEEEQKMMSGKDAPYLWQDGKFDKVIKYCEDDVRLERLLLDKIFENGGLINPKNKKYMRMALPHG
jgi:hypothetical protein